MADPVPSSSDPGAEAAARPLAGVQVVDMTSVFMGPSATQMLGDLGAEVIKVEAPGGDMMRTVGAQGDKGLGPLFLGLNRSKRSIVLDLKHPEGLAALVKLAARADILAYNVRPQAMQRLGLGYDELAAINPRLVYAGMYGFSQRGPYAARAAFDDLIQAASGLPAAMAAASDGVPRYVPVTIADRAVGLYAFGVIAAALFERERTGRGRRVDIPMFETMVPLVMGDHLYGETFVPPQGGFGYPRLLTTMRRPYRTRDGYICCLIYTDGQWRRFLAEIGQGELFDADPRFRTLSERTRHIEELYGIVAQALEARTNAEWLERLPQIDIPVFPVHDFASLVADEHLAAIGFFRESEHPHVGRVRQMSSPSEWSGAPIEPHRPHAPKLGEHSREVLREIGYDDAAIDALVSDGVTQDLGG